jgi:hypothetical protein
MLPVQFDQKPSFAGVSAFFHNISKKVLLLHHIFILQETNGIALA